MLALDEGANKIGGALDRARHASFAGLELEISGEPEPAAQLARAARPPAPTAPLPQARRCRITATRLDTGPDTGPVGGALTWRWRDVSGDVLTRFAHARVSERDGELDARVAITPDPRAAATLLAGLAALLLHRRGGTILHAASVEIDGAALAFIGPSGAGKSTAGRHVAGAPLVSVDRLAVLPAPSGLPDVSAPPGAMWFAHALPGGTRSAADAASAVERWRPLAGILRVQHSANGTRVRALSRATAVALLRESTFQIGAGARAEAELLASLERLAERVPVARLALELGVDLDPLVRRWLTDARGPDPSGRA